MKGKAYDKELSYIENENTVGYWLAAGGGTGPLTPSQENVLASLKLKKKQYK